MARSEDPEAWAPALEQFEHHLIASEMEPRTVELRLYHLRRFANAHPAGPATVTPAQSLKYLARTDWAPATRAVVRACMTSFYGWAVPVFAPSNPTSSLPSVKQVKRAPNLPSRKIVRDAIRDASPRVKLMIRLGADAGLSAMEIAAARHSDIQERDGDYAIRTQSRGSTVRLVPLPPSLAEDLLALGGDRLFPHRQTGKPMGAAYISRLVSKALPEQYTSDSLRLAFLANPSRLTSWRDANFHSPEDSTFLDAAELEDAKSLHARLRKIERFMESDPGTAISECKNIIEELSKQLLRAFDMLPSGHPNMPMLRDRVVEALDLRGNSVEGDAHASAELAGLIESSFSGLNQLRNNLGTGHGGGAQGKVEPHHARLALNVTVTLAEYLLVRWREMKADR